MWLTRLVDVGASSGTSRKSNMVRFGTGKTGRRKEGLSWYARIQEVMSYKYLGIELDNHLNERLARETIRRKARKGIVLATNAYWKGLILERVNKFGSK